MNYLKSEDVPKSGTWTALETFETKMFQNETKCFKMKLFNASVTVGTERVTI